ncbi:hypothetical protein BJX96DRAFT_170179 [Aspergillus floccosus]
MVRVFSVLALVLLAITPAESVRAPQPGGQQVPLLKGAVGAGFQGRFATGGPHSQPSRQAPVTIPPRISNKAHLVRVGKKHDLTIGLERPYEALFGHAGINKHNYRNAVYSNLKDFNSSAISA